MGKIILLVLGVALVYWILRAYRRRLQHDAPQPREGVAEDMVRCAHCGVHLPKSESVTTHGQFFCSAEHQRLHRRSG